MKEWKEYYLYQFLKEKKEKNINNKYNEENVLSVSKEKGVVNQIELLGRSFAGKSLNKYKIVEPGNVIYTKSPVKDNPFGVIKACKNNFGIVSTLYAVYECNEKIAIPQYLDYYFSINSNLNNYLMILVDKGAKNTMNISNTKFLEGKILLPSIEQQKKIIIYLEKIDMILQKITFDIEKNINLKNALYKRLLREGIEKEELVKTKIGMVNKNWRILKAGKVFSNVNIKNKENEKVLAVTQDRGIIERNKCGINMQYSNENLKNYKYIENHNYVISMRSFQGGIEYSEISGIVSPAYTILKNIIPINYDYYQHYFKSNAFISDMEYIVEGIRDGKQINYNKFSNMDIVYPPIEEQKRISIILNRIVAKIDFLKEKKTAYINLRLGLLQNLLMGKVRIKI